MTKTISRNSRKPMHNLFGHRLRRSFRIRGKGEVDMKQQTRRITLVVAVAALLFAATGEKELFAQAAQNLKGKRLSLGIVFKGPREPIEAHFQDFVDYVARQLYSMP